MDKQGDSPTSRFTPVNGRDAPISGPPNGSRMEGPPKRTPEERINGQARISPAGQEKLTISTNTPQAHEWNTLANGSRPTTTTGPSYPSAPSGYPENEVSHKRKRSGSTERQNGGPGSYHSHGLPTPKPHESVVVGDASDSARELSHRLPSQAEIQGSYGSGQSYVQYGDEGREQNPNLWYNQEPRDSQMETQHSGLSHSTDDVLREALTSHSQGGVDNGRNFTTSPTDENEQGSPYPSQYGSDRASLQLQADHKKRKRNFSNRTKTGCMTCRKRKKKCDELRPECKL